MASLAAALAVAGTGCADSEPAPAPADISGPPQRVARTVDRLERSKLVRRTQGSDRRVKVVTILAAGESAQEAVAKSMDSSEFGLGGVPAESLDELAVMLRQVRLLVEGRMDSSD